MSVGAGVEVNASWWGVEVNASWWGVEINASWWGSGDRCQLVGEW